MTHENAMPGSDGSLHQIPDAAITAPLLQVELASAQAEMKNGIHVKAEKSPIIPVPADAPTFNFEIPTFGGKPSRTYSYHDETGQLIGYIARWDIINTETGVREKKILPVCFCELPDGKKVWRSVGIPSPRPLYRLPDIFARTDAPILICEGEKTADAAQALFPDFVVTTPMHGAQSPRKTDWSPVKGHKVIIATDYDEAGSQFGDVVYDLCIEAGAEGIFHLPSETIGKRQPTDAGFDSRDEAVPQGYDLADALEQGWTAQDMERFVQLVPLRPYIKNSELCDLNNHINSMFRLTPNGVEHARETKDRDGNPVVEWTWFCSYLAIIYQTRDTQGQNWGRVCVIVDNDGKRKEYILPMAALAGDGVAYREALLSCGVRLAPNANKLLHYYITTANPKARATCVLKSGWHDDCYVMPYRVYGKKSGERIVLQQTQPVANLVLRGTIQEWQANIGRLCAGNSRLVFAVCLALTGPLLEPIGEENFGFHVDGSSSIGKTTLLHVAVSVWGTKIQSWRTTDNAAEGLARQANDAFLALDELSQIDGFSADAMAYMLGNGSGKARSRRDGSAKPAEQFRLVFLSSGETGLTAKIQESGKQTKAGQTVRFIEIPADGGRGHGVFDCLHDVLDGNHLSIELKHLAGQYTGAVADAFLNILCANRDATVAGVVAARKYWVEKYIPMDSDGQVRRVGQKFALVAAVGELAIASGILPWPSGEAENACVRLFNDWLTARGGTQAHEAKDIECRLRAFMAEHGSARFEAAWQEGIHNGFDRKTMQRAGFKRMTDAGAWEYFIMPPVFEKEIIGGLNKALVKSHLAQRGLILRDSAGKYTISIRVPGYGQSRLYHIPASILGAEDSHVDA